jgi:hypothetical protein
MTESQPITAKTSPLLIVLAWAVVGVPWLWGITQTLNNAVKLFQ